VHAKLRLTKNDQAHEQRDEASLWLKNDCELIAVCTATELMKLIDNDDKASSAFV
jgi:hypothetical protein